MNKLDKITEIRHIMTSKNGYPVYDLMMNSDIQGYVSASGTAFYTEDDNVLKKLKAIRETEDILSFMKENKKYLVNAASVPFMGERQSLAYWHLVTPDALKTTLEKKYYGCAHLVEEEKILVFYQNAAHGIYNDCDLTKPEEFKNASLKLLNAYMEGKVSPDCVFTGGAFEKLKNTLGDSVMVPKVAPIQPLKEELEAIINFANHFDIKVRMKYENDVVHLNIFNKDYAQEYKLSKSDEMLVNGSPMKIEKFLRTIFADSQVVENSIESIVNKTTNINHKNANFSKNSARP